MSTLIFPIFPWIFQVLVIGYFCAVALYAASIGKATFKVVDPMNHTANCSCSSVIVSHRERIIQSINFNYWNAIYFLSGLGRHMYSVIIRSSLQMPWSRLPVSVRRHELRASTASLQSFRSLLGPVLCLGHGRDGSGRRLFFLVLGLQQTS